MAGLSIYQKKELDEQLFEGRHKAYGAYVHRNKAESYRLRAFIIALVLIFSAYLVPFVQSQMKPEKDQVVADRRVVPYSHLSAPPPIERDRPPPPEYKVPPKKAEVKKFVQPTVKPDEEVIEEEMPTLEELKEVTTGPTAIEGIDSVYYDSEPEVVLDDEQQETMEPDVPPKVEPFVVVERMPEFPGGAAALYKYLAENIQYPGLAMEMGIEGKVYIQFVVDTSGWVRDAEVVRGIGGGCDEAALEIVRNMPRWEPGTQRDRKVPVVMTVPVRFVLKKQ